MSHPANQHFEPAEEEDISRAGVYHDEPAPNPGGSKGKQRADNPFHDDDASSSEEEYGGEKKYPPNIDEEEESRRVAETLKRWEEAERQRRKAARESQLSATSSSLVSDVTRRASLLWPGRRRSQQGPPKGPGTHHKLRNSEDEVALDEMDTRVSSPPTPEPSNPFATPAASTLSLNNPEGSAIMHESDSGQTLTDDRTDVAPVSQRPSLGRQGSTRAQSPPRPLDLPAPRSPPPRTETPHANRPPEPTQPPKLQRADVEEEPERRWWTEWLCGCRESGENQAGRTNPFE